jgi:diguanylate cyclase (GGDEF)-like protein
MHDDEVYPMTKRKVAGAESSGRDVSGLALGYLFSYLQSCEPEGTLEAVLRGAGETRPLASLRSGTTWSSYEQFRRMLESTAKVLGGPQTLALVGRHVFDVIQSPALSESLAAMGSPAAVFWSLPPLMESTLPVVELLTEDLGPNECRIRFRFKDGHEGFPENCAYQLGLLASLPKVYGTPEAEVFSESCQCDGAPYCQARLRWAPINNDAARLLRAELQSRLSEARLQEFQTTLAGLVSGDGLPTVLSRVVEATARAVPALFHVLDVNASAITDRWVCAEGIEEVEAARVCAQLALTPGAETPSHVERTPVASDRRHYGHLVSVRANVADFKEFERSILESYARLAASALDSERAIVDARQQASTAQALLTLSSSLSELASTEEMVRRIAHAVPAIVSCDRVVVWIIEPGEKIGKVSATFGFDPATEAQLRSISLEVPGNAGFVTEVYRHQLPLKLSAFPIVLLESGSVEAISFPIIYANEAYGWITVDVTTHPERLGDDADITERLKGLAGQAAVAIRNGRLLAEIRHQALHDSLTGLPNRVLVLDRISQTLSRARREHTDVAVLFIDLDGLKDVNDTLGHARGDKLLQAVATRFAGTLREADTVARLGGDEFVVLADGPSLAAGPEQLAERLLEVLAEPFGLGARGQVPTTISASIGIAVGLRDTAEEMLRDADVAMYSAKGAGKNRYAFFEVEMQTERRYRHELEMDLQAAVGTDQFFLAYQPIFNLTTMAVVGTEALLRWRHPVRGLFQPDAFIPALEASGLIIPVGCWVLFEACRQADEWRKAGHSMRMSVNASTCQLDGDSLVSDVSHALSASGLPADDLIIEITETGLMADAKGAHEQLTALKALGVRIAIDDFGTGYSSLAYLQQFPVDSLKIDRSFIAGMGESREGDALIHTLMQLGRALRLETLAEGIEEVAQLTQLQFERCQFGQGFLLARPMPAEEAEQLFTAPPTCQPTGATPPRRSRSTPRPRPATPRPAPTPSAPATRS